MTAMIQDRNDSGIQVSVLLFSSLSRTKNMSNKASSEVKYNFESAHCPQRSFFRTPNPVLKRGLSLMRIPWPVKIVATVASVDSYIPAR